MSFPTAELNSSEWSRIVKMLRKEKGWSQQDLADRLGIHPQSISEIERGNERFTLERLYRLLDALDYRGEIKIRKKGSETRSDWGPIYEQEPTKRRLIENAREFSEKLAEELYKTFGVEKVYCIGSLVRNRGAEFSTDSDIDLLVKGLDPSDLISAERTLEINHLEPPREGQDFSFDLIRAENYEDSPATLIEDEKAVPIPRLQDNK